MDQHPYIRDEELLRVIFLYVLELQLWELLCVHMYIMTVTMPTGTHSPLVYHEAKSLKLVLLNQEH